VATLPSSSGSEDLELRNASDGSLVQDVTYPRDAGLAYGVVFSPAGRIALGRVGGAYLYDGSAPRRLLARFDTDPGPPPRSDPDCKRPNSCLTTVGALAFSPDDRLLAFQELRAWIPWIPQQQNRRFVYVVDASNGRRVAKLDASTGRPQHVSFSPDGRRLVAMHDASENGRNELHVRVWDTSTWALLEDIGGLGPGFEPLATGAVEGAEFAAVYAASGRIELRDLARNRVLWSKPLISPPVQTSPTTIRAPELELDHVAIAPNGKFVVSYEGAGWTLDPKSPDRPDGIGYMSAIVVRDAHDGSIMAAYDVPDVTDFAISPDSRTLVYSVGFHQTYVALARLPR
jgi:WD40 repeat protein